MVALEAIQRRSLWRPDSAFDKDYEVAPRCPPRREALTRQSTDPALLYGQVVKEREGRKIVKVEKRLVLGSPTTELAFISSRR